jgi:hypothetical protein
MSLDRILDKLKQWRRPWLAGTEPLEIHRALLEEIEAQVVAVGGGRRVFPFDRVEVKLLAPTAEDAVRLEAIVESGWDLEREVRERLAAAGARCPDELAIPIEIARQGGPEFGDRRYAVAFRRAAPSRAAGPAPDGASAAAPVAPEAAGGEPAGPDGPAAEATGTARAEGLAEGAGPPRAGGEPRAEQPSRAERPSRAGRPALHLTVLKGKAVRETYDLGSERIYLGRLEEVLDPSGRVMRRNDVAFLDDGDLEQTVSREHARIAWDAEGRSFWLRDEGSASGTLIFRAGRALEVSRHDRRGVRLESGDEIYLGRAALKVEIAGAAGH